MKFTRLLAATALASAAFAIPQAAFAQTVEQETDSEAVAETTEEQGQAIVVTGSRIARPNLDSNIPVVSVGIEELTSTGDVSLGDALNQLPALNQTYSQSNSTRFIGTAGLNLLDLRGLGTGRTLVLVNGRRHVSSSPGSFEVDVNTIPIDLVQRVDLVTGGNSGIYGSDAVAGVVNFVLRRDYEGVALRGQSGISSRGDRGSYFISATAGKNLFDNRLNIAANLEYTKSDVLYHADRDEQTGALTGSHGFARIRPASPARPGVPETAFVTGITHPSFSLGGTIATACPAATATNAAQRALICTGTRNPTGQELSNAYVFDVNGNLVRDVPQVDLRPIGGTSLLGGRGASLLETTMLYPELERYAGNLLISADISPAFQPFLEAKFVRVNALQSGQPSFGTYGFSVNNPFLNDQARATLAAIRPGLTTFSISRFNTDFGPRGEVHERETYRIVGGVSGQITSNVRYEVALNYGRTETYYETRGNHLIQNFNNALNAVRDPATGQIVCAINLNPATADPNCVPINLFGSGAPSQEALNYIRHVSTRDAYAEQQNAVAFISADSSGFLNLPGGPIGVALGGEYRRESAYSAYDDITRTGQTFLNAIDTFAPPALEVKEAFGEIRVPLLANMPLVHELTIEGSGRVSNYSAGPGTVWAWNVSGTYAPFRDMRVRAGYAKSVRSPTLSNLFSTGSDTFATINDPCDSEFITRNPNRAANCAAAGVPTTEVFNGVVVPWTNRSTATHLGRNQGNPDVGAETGYSFTVGAVFEPSFAPGLTASVDYYNIRVENVIASLGGQTVVDLCYDNPGGIENQYCAAVFRRADGTFAGQDDRRVGSATGNPEQLGRTGPSFLSQPFNFANLKASGIDAEVAYRRNIGGNTTLNIRAIASYVINREQFTDVTQPDYSTRLHGQLGDPIWAGTLNTNVDFGVLDLSYNLRFVGKQTIGGWEATFGHDGRPATTPDLYPVNFYPDILYHNIRVGIEPTERFRLYGGIDNVLDQLPPYGLDGRGAGSAIFPTVGRFMYIGAEVRF